MSEPREVIYLAKNLGTGATEPYDQRPGGDRYCGLDREPLCGRESLVVHWPDGTTTIETVEVVETWADPYYHAMNHTAYINPTIRGAVIPIALVGSGLKVTRQGP